MKAIRFYGPGDVRYETAPDAVLQEDSDVLIKVDRCGICGSDLHIYQGLAGISSGCSIGHEAIGEIVETGRSVQRFRTGDRVMLSAMVGCGRCVACLSGNMLRCKDGKLSGYGFGLGLDGCQADAVRVPMADINVEKIPDGVSDNLALLLTDNLPTAFAACKRADITPGATVAVIGLGPIGLLAVQLAYAMGASVVVGIDINPDRRAIAAGFGAVTFGPNNVVGEVRELTSGAMIDGVIEAVGSKTTVALALELVGRMRTVSVLGNATEPTVTFPPETFLFGITFRVMYATEVSRYWPELIPMVRSGRLQAEAVITHSFAMSDGAQAYSDYDKRLNGILKPILIP